MLSCLVFAELLSLQELSIVDEAVCVKVVVPGSIFYKKKLILQNLTSECCQSWSRARLHLEAVVADDSLGPRCAAVLDFPRGSE